MLTVLQAIFLGIIQGVTEWLPVSSSGHLVLTQKLLNLTVPLAFDVWLHIATLIVILVFFRQDITKILRAMLKWQTNAYEFKLAVFIMIGSVVTAAIALIFKNLFEENYFNLLLVGVAFLVTGTLLFFSEKNPSNKRIKGSSAALIGAVQGIAFIPGISRSGSTIATALLLGIKKEDAFRLSFLFVIPPAIAASILKIGEIATSNIPVTTMAAGFITAVAVGFLSLNFLKRVVMHKGFHYFAYYCWLIGILTLIVHITFSF